jgi:Superfamily I DNA and RNA helicases and helicase subunits
MLTPALIIERNWWESAWQNIPDQYKPEVSSTGLFTVEFLRKIKRQFNNWRRELAQDETELKRSKNFVTDWIKKLRNPSEKDQSDLKQIYIDNANVIGITCVQAASFDFSKNFPSFDAVIIDEVSKCTPPELLIPALKGKKLVLVGDHRQLPPMFDRNTIDDIAEEIGCTGDELSFIKESLFKVLFENASDSIKQMLTTQYRMHPQIMGAINQFYDQKLNCGIAEPDTRRAHNLAGKIIQENNHILWVKTPVGQGFEEEKNGTSRLNVKEVDAIERLCEQMEAAWLPKIADGEPPKEIGIITFYGAQLRLIQDRIEPEKFPSLSIRTGTVDIFQGMERPVIIVSTVCNNNRGDIGFAKEPERVNVAFSRAQELLVVVGCHDLFTQQTGTVGKMYQEVSKIVRYFGGFVDVSSVIN